MQVNYVTTRNAGTVGEVDGGTDWKTKANGLINDSSSTYAASGGGIYPKDLLFSNYGFDLPIFAKVDGIEVNLTCRRDGSPGFDSMALTWTGGNESSGESYDWAIAGSTLTYGNDSNDWGKSDWTAANINDTAFGIACNYNNGGAMANVLVQYQSITVYWHIDIATAEAEVPTRFDYKTYDRSGKYLGDLPKVTSEFKFSQDINTAGSTLDITCGVKADNNTTVEDLLTEDSLPILAEDSDPLMAEETTFLIIAGNSDIEALFKNSNRVEVFMYNYWYPNGKKMFAGQVNRVAFSYGGTSDNVSMTLFSDGFDLTNFIARGYPFLYNNDVVQTSQDSLYYIYTNDDGTHVRFGQTWKTGAGVTTLGSISVMLTGGAASVILNVYDKPNGTLLGTVTKYVNAPSPIVVSFDFPTLITVTPLTSYFFTISTPVLQFIGFRYAAASVYANGTRYIVDTTAGAPAFYTPTNGDLYFVTKSGTPTTTTTYSSKDPITGMLSPIMIDYNNRGGIVKEGAFTAAGLTTTYTFNMATIFDAMVKALEMSPDGYYSYIDLGTGIIDVPKMSTTQDFTVVRGKDVNQIVMGLSIEQLKNYLLFTGGEIGGGINLYRDYKDADSQNYYGLRTAAKTDNRVTVPATADAIGTSFIAENASEIQQTSVTVINKNIDITLLTPGKTIGFRNFGSFIDGLTLQIVRRDFNPNDVTLTLGQLPVRTNDEVQKIVKGLLNEQTVNNPNSPG